MTDKLHESITIENDWDMESIIDRLSTLTDMHKSGHEIDRPLLAEELESMSIWLKT